LTAVRYSSQESNTFKEASDKIVPALVNILAIINHFSPKIDSWSSNNEVESLTEQDVLEVVRNNYDSLVLKLQEGLDVYDSYTSQEPEEDTFFQGMVRQVIQETRGETNSSKSWKGLKDRDYSRHSNLLRDIVTKEEQQLLHQTCVVSSLESSTSASIISYNNGPPSL